MQFSGSLSGVTPRKGIIYRTPWGGDALSINDLKGTYYMFEIGGHLTAMGGNVWVMFISGVTSHIAAQVGMLAYGPVGWSTTLLESSKAVILSGGGTAHFSKGFNVSGSAYLGAIW